MSLGWWALFRIAHLHVNVQKATLHYLKSEPHLHTGTNSVEEALICVSVHAHKVPAYGGKNQQQAQE